VGKISMIGLDLAKSVFQVHGVDGSGAAVLKQKLRRERVLGFFASLDPCLVVMEACGSGHYWAREIAKCGHETKLIPASYVKPFVKRQKNDAADAEAICEAASRPIMRFVAGKSEAQQASAVVFRARDLLVRQRTQIINALRGHLAEFGFVVPKGPAHVTRLLAIVEEDAALPESIRAPLQGMVATLRVLEAEVAKLDKEIAARAKSDADARRLMTIPGVGPITATALLSIAPPAAAFENGRHFAAWLGLAPRQHSSGGKDKLGRITKAGDKTLRRLLIIGASAVLRHAAIKPPPAGSWLARMMAGKPRMLVAVALANKMARIIWALLRNGTSYQASSAAA